MISVTCVWIRMSGSECNICETSKAKHQLCDECDHCEPNPDSMGNLELMLPKHIAAEEIPVPEPSPPSTKTEACILFNSYAMYQLEENLGLMSRDCKQVSCGFSVVL